MSLSQSEKDRRHHALRKWMSENAVDIMMVFGDTGDWGLRYGHLRYLTDGKVIFGNSVLLFPLEREPILFMSSELQANWTRKLSWIPDTRPSTHFVSDVVNTLKLLPLKKAVVGVANLGSLPLSWSEALRRELPSVNLIDGGPIIEKMRSVKADEEIELLGRSAQLADKGFDNVIRGLKPGMTEFEVLAMLETPMRKAGGDDFFNLIFSGPFGPGINMMPFSPTGGQKPERTVQTGDSLLFEITPRYGGYWTQLVRIVNIGKENALLTDYHRVVRECVQAAIHFFRPGVPMRDGLLQAKKVAEAAGYEFRFPSGHYCGLNVVEPRIGMGNNEILEAGMVFTFHPCVGSGATQVFSGETYVITSEGCRSLNRASTELLTI